MAETTATDERPDPERTVIVEKAHLLHDQIEHSDEEAENAINDIAKGYHKARTEETQEIAAKIEGDGLQEVDIREMKADAEDRLDEFDEETPEHARVLAKYDTAKQTLEEYFGDQRGPVELGSIMASSVYEGGAVELNGTKNAAILELTDEVNARATADAVLGGADLSLEEERRKEVF